MTVLGEIVVEERQDCVALIVRRPARWFPWDVWTIVRCTNSDQKRGHEDPTLGAGGFEAKRGLQRFYIDDITYYAKKVGVRHRKEKAEELAKRKLDKFLRWRHKMIAIRNEVEAERAAREG